MGEINVSFFCYCCDRFNVVKRTFSLLILLFTFLTIGVEASEPVRSIAYQPFEDVKTDAWYCEPVKTVYEYGLMNGKGNNLFDPDGELTLAEAITIAARLHVTFTDGQQDFSSSDPWYVSYIDYAREYGFLSDLYIYPTGNVSFDTFPSSAIGLGWPSTRLRFAVLIAHAVPDKWLPEINSIEDLSIPDVSQYWHQEEIDAVYKLYRAGILTGKDADGMFRGVDAIKRSEAAAIISCVVDSSLRKRIELKREISNTPITDEEAVRLVSKQTHDPILQSFVYDYDQDGKNEAFVVTGIEWDFFTPVTVWYVSSGRADQLYIGIYSFTTSEITYGMDDLGGVSVFHYFGSFISYGTNRIWRVMDGKPITMELSKDQVTDTDSNSILLYTVYDHSNARMTYDPSMKGYVAKTAAYQYSEVGNREVVEGMDEYHLLQYDNVSNSLVWTLTKLNIEDEWKPRK